jgi:threonine/homoserine/homoserine lactone efflux protein
VIQAENLSAALLGIVILAIMVNFIELACTAGFPALYTEILTSRNFEWWQYYGYLAIYNMAYMADDALMVTIAVVTLSHRKLQEREGRWLKGISGLVMLGLGLTLLAVPEWLL